MDDLKEDYIELMALPNEIFGIFSDYFGEDRVDLQDFPELEDYIDNPRNYLEGTILVHFPYVRITNENDRFVDVNHLWVKVRISSEGKLLGGIFTIGRSEYQASHLVSDFMHSHCPGIPMNFSEFLQPCLGSGPIRQTTTTLTLEYEEAMWKLFCLELDKFIGIESLAGVPYRKLERISGDKTSDVLTRFDMYPNRFTASDCFNTDHLAKFIAYLIDSNALEFNFIGGSYGLAMSYIRYIILVSNKFIEWYNMQIEKHTIPGTYEKLLEKGFLEEVKIFDNEIRLVDPSIRGGGSIRSCEGKYVCTFKGNRVLLHIVEDRDISNKVLILNHEIAEIIAEAILKVLNYRYGRDEQHNDQEGNAPSNQKTVLYL